MTFRLVRPLVVVSLLWALPALAQGGGSLERCRTADEEFDYETVLTECGLAAAEPTLVDAQRLEAYQLLGIAHTALGDATKAEIWFTRLLILNPAHELPDAVSPVYREAFAKAKERFAREGKVTVTHVAPTVNEGRDKNLPIALQFDIDDKLGRVAEARVRVVPIVDDDPGQPIDGPLARAATDTPGRFSWTGPLPDPVAAAGQTSGAYVLEYSLVLLGPGGHPVEPDPAFAPARLTLTSPDSGGVSPMLLGGIAGGAAAVGLAALLIGGSTAAAIVCLGTPMCTPPQTPSREISFVKVQVATEEAP